MRRCACAQRGGGSTARTSGATWGGHTGLGDARGHLSREQGPPAPWGLGRPARGPPFPSEAPDALGPSPKRSPCGLRAALHFSTQGFGACAVQGPGGAERAQRLSLRSPGPGGSLDQRGNGNTRSQRKQREPAARAGIPARSRLWTHESQASTGRLEGRGRKWGPAGAADGAQPREPAGGEQHGAEW